MPRPNTAREVGRPRLFSDEAIFGATQHLIEQHGYSALTLDAIAKDVGCTRQALVRRFGSKQSLLLAYLDQMLMSMAANYQITTAENDSPLHALRTRFTAPPEERMEVHGDRSVQANILVFMLLSGGNPAFGTRFESFNQIYLDEMERLVRAAIEQGELIEIDPAMLARTLFSASLGETVRWASTSSDVPHVSLLAEIFDLVITPYRAS